MKSKNSDIGHLESEIGLLKSEKAQVASEMSAVNQVKIITFIAANDNRIGSRYGDVQLAADLLLSFLFHAPNLCSSSLKFCSDLVRMEVTSTSISLC